MGSNARLIFLNHRWKLDADGPASFYFPDTNRRGMTNAILVMAGRDLSPDFIFAAFDPKSPAAPSMFRKIVSLRGDKYKKPLALNAA